VKASIGHTEPAAGIVGLVKLALGLRHMAAPNVHLRVLNPHIGSTSHGYACALPVQSSVVAGCDAVNSEASSEYGLAYRKAGVSSFGYSGTIVHTLLRPDLGVGQSGILTHRAVVLRRRLFWHLTLQTLDSGGELISITALLNHVGLAEHLQKFEDAGYDDVLYLRTLSETEFMAIVQDEMMLLESDCRRLFRCLSIS